MRQTAIKTATTTCLSFLALAGPQAQHGGAPPVSWAAREAVWVLAWTSSCPNSATGEELVVAVVIMRFCGFGGGGTVSCSGG